MVKKYLKYVQSLCPNRLHKGLIRCRSYVRTYSDGREVSKPHSKACKRITKRIYPKILDEDLSNINKSISNVFENSEQKESHSNQVVPVHIHFHLQSYNSTYDGNTVKIPSEYSESGIGGLLNEKY